MRERPSTPETRSNAARSSRDHTYNRPLDYLRVTALLLMTCIHTSRGFLGWSGVDGVLRTIGETAPVFFFVALGMTQRRLVSKPIAEQVRRLGWFGVVSFAQSYFMWFALHWEFFMFLWAASVVVVLGSAGGLTARHFLLLGLLILAVNGIVSLTPMPPPGTPVPADFWLRYGPFFPLPWVALVFIGVGLGVDFPHRWRRPAVILALIVVAAVAAAISIAKAPAELIGFRFEAEKGAATSAYLVGATASTICFYLLFGWFPGSHGVWRHINALLRFVSDRLLLATVLHFLSIRMLTDPRWHWSIGAGFVRTGTWGELVLLVGSSIGLLLVLLVGVSVLWDLLCARYGSWLDHLRFPWVAVVVLGGLTLMRLKIGLIGIFSYRWTAFALMLLAALLGDRVRRRPANATPAVEASGA